MLSMKEMEELDTVKTRIENCIAQEEAHRDQLQEMLGGVGQRLLALQTAQRTVNKFLNSVNVSEEKKS